jgi:hypothetical protein
MAVAFATWPGCCTAAPPPSLTRDKQAPPLQHLHHPAIHQRDPREIIMAIPTVDAVEVEEMGSVVGQQTHQRGRWPAMEHRPGVVVAYGLGTPQDEVFLP